jgi:hypothetical protein
MLVRWPTGGRDSGMVGYNVQVPSTPSIISLFAHEATNVGSEPDPAISRDRVGVRSVGLEAIRKMKKHLCLVCHALAGLTILHFPALAETANPNSTAAPAAISAPLKTNGQSSKKTAKNCDDEWRADQEAMMKHGMTEDSYVEQCSVEDDVPAIPSERKQNAAPSAAPK